MTAPLVTGQDAERPWHRVLVLLRPPVRTQSAEEPVAAGLGRG
ncbi:hypothetical protein [Planotetraspora silvatica]|nr:hypothetical protein [Planotetraspora silvatica]